MKVLTKIIVSDLRVVRISHVYVLKISSIAAASDPKDEIILEDEDSYVFFSYVRRLGGYLNGINVFVSSFLEFVVICGVCVALTERMVYQGYQREYIKLHIV